MKFQKWQYDEMKHMGVDYADAFKTHAYDSKIQKIRDVGGENAEIISALALSKEHNILDFGAGTGGFAIEAAKHCNNVFAVDISPSMLDFARKKAEAEKVDNMQFHQGGFLTYEHHGEPLDAIVSQFALHHLPDFWKLIALKRICGMLREGGKFYLRDAVYSFDINNHGAFFGRMLAEIEKSGSADFARDIETSIGNEYSTLNWIMEGHLARAGFVIDVAEYRHGILACYLCSKIQPGKDAAPL